MTPSSFTSGSLKPVEYRSRQVAGICVLLVIAVFLVYKQTFHFDFVNYDDDANVYEVPQVTAGVSLRGIEWALTHAQINRWTPLATLSRQIDCQFFGLRAGGHHLTNVLLHALATVLLFLVLLDLTGFPLRSGFVAAVFALHPLHVEAVAWVSERSELLCAVFFMLALLSYANYTRKPRRLHYAMAMFWFALGLMSKPMIVTLPFVMLLLDYWPLVRFGKVSLSRLIFEKIPFILLALVFCAATFFFSGHDQLAVHLPLLLRVQNAVVSCAIYLRQTVWPAGLAAYYPNPTHLFSFAETAGSLALLCCITAVAFLWRKKHPALVMGWLWFLGMLAPVIGLVQISTYAHADRYTYLPQIGLSMAATWLVADWTVNWRHRRALLGSVAAIVLLVLLIASHHQTSYWRNGITLWTHTLECTTDNSYAHNNLGIDLTRQGATAEGIAQYREALRIDPNNAAAHYNLGIELFQQGQTQEAIDQYRNALRINPAYAAAHNNLGLALVQQGQIEEAIAHYHQALRLDPDNSAAFENLGVALFQQGRTGDAIVQFREALRINPADAHVHSDLGTVLFQQGQTDDAIAEFREALRLDPEDVNTREKLDIALRRETKP